MDEFQAAFQVFCREVGARVAEFMGFPEEKDHVMPDELLEATRTIIRLTAGMDDRPDADPDDPEQVAVVQQETLAQAFEEAWDSYYSERVTVTAKRAELLRFFEDQAGRPLNLAQDPGVDPGDVSELHIAFLEGASRSIAEGNPVRCYSLDDDGIFLETLEPLIPMAFPDYPFVRADELDSDDLETVLARWRAEPKLYLAKRDNLRDEATGRYFVDTTMRASGRKAAEALRDMTGGGNLRTRAEMMSDPEHPGLAEAMLGWERGDDSLYADVYRERAQAVVDVAPEARERVRLGIF